jgi:hypothetical protein
LTNQLIQFRDECTKKDKADLNNMGYIALVGFAFIGVAATIDFLTK